MCAQLYAQRAGQPDAWVMSGAPASTAIWLSRDTPINYSDGTTDTVPANTPAQVVGGGTSFNRTNDVFVPFIYKGDPTLRIIKEALLPTLTSDYHPMARVELHAVKPYQPQAYLGAGGLGDGSPTTTTLVSATTAKAHSLWNGSSNDAPPASWQTPAYDDSAWAAAALSPDEGVTTYISGTHIIWTAAPVPTSAGQEQILIRHHLTLPAGALTAASLLVMIDDLLLAGGLFLNGVALAAGSLPFTWGTNPPLTGALSASVPLTAFVAGADNVLAFWVSNDTNPGDTAGGASYKLTVTQNSGGAPDPTSAEGDLIYRHSGTLIALPIGPSGDVLTSDGSDPYWAADTDYTDPLSAKGDLLTRSSSATVRLGVGSNGQVLTADSTQTDGIKWATPAAGSVTSVALAGPTGTSVSGSPVTSSGTLTLSWASQSANTFLGAPNGSSGAPTFRVLVAGDMPSLPASQITSGQLTAARGGTGLDGSAAANGALLIGTGSGYSLATLSAGAGVTITNASGTVTIASTGGGSGSVTSVALTVPSFLSVSGSPVTTSGTLAVTLQSENAATVFAGPASGSAAAPTFRALAASDLPAAAAAGGHIHAHGHFL